MWARVGRECFMKVVRFELSLEEFESRGRFGSVQTVDSIRIPTVAEKRETTKR